MARGSEEVDQPGQKKERPIASPINKCQRGCIASSSSGRLSSSSHAVSGARLVGSP